MLKLGFIVQFIYLLYKMTVWELLTKNKNQEFVQSDLLGKIFQHVVYKRAYLLRTLNCLTNLNKTLTKHKRHFQFHKIFKKSNKNVQIS